MIFTAQPHDIYKIADFGIAKFVGKQGKTLTNVGSPIYMAPEQLYDRYDIKTDIYALGILFYELLHGNAPFTGSHASIFKGHLEVAVPISNDLPSQVRQLLQEMLAKRPEARPHAIAVRAALNLLASSYDINVSLPVFEDNNQRIDHPSGETLFAELFDTSQSVASDSTAPPSVSAPSVVSGTTTASPSRESIPIPEYTVTLDMHEKSADHFFHFDDDMEPPARPNPAPDTPERTAPAMQAEGLFDEGFEDAERVQDDMAFRLSGELSQEPIYCGHLQITPQWTRAVDTKAFHLVNLYDDDALLVVTQNGVHELKNQAGKGVMLYQGPVQAIGIPTQGLLPILMDQEVVALQREHTEPHVWAMQEPVEQLCFAPQAQGVAALMQKTLYYHDQEGNLLWSGQLSDDASEVYVDFEDSGTLIVTTYHANDQGVYFYGRDGQVLAQHWLPGRIVAAARCHFGSGIWLVISNHRGAQLLHLTHHDTVSPPRPIERPLRRLMGTAHWLCGVDETNILHVLDPATGHMAPIPLPGKPLGYCPGTDEGLLYVLEARSEVLRYISTFAIEQLVAEGDTCA